MSKLLGTAAVLVALVSAAFAQAPPSNHVVLVPLENQSYSQVIGSPSMPYLNSLATKYSSASSFYANAHPSIANYFMMTTGKFVTTDNAFAGTVSDDNLVRRLVTAGKTWKAYAEDLPSVGFLGHQYPYVKRHNPFAYFSDVVNSTTQQANLVPLDRFHSDISANTLPNFSFVLPNNYNNSHDCPPSIPNCSNTDKLVTADNWLRANLEPLLASAPFQSGGDGLLIITFDEGTDNVNGGGQIAYLMIGPQVKQGFATTLFRQHENVLRMISQALGLPQIGAAAHTADFNEMFVNGVNQGTPARTSRTSLFFNTTPVGSSSATRTFNLYNNRSVALNITGASSSNPEFTHTTTCGSTLAVGANCAYTVKFTPSASGFRAGTLTIQTDGANSPHEVYLGGTASGLGGAVSVSPTSLSFGSQAAGSTSSAQRVTVTNGESVAVAIDSITTSGAFQQTHNCGTQLAAEASCGIDVRFSPTASGSTTGTLTISYTGAGSPKLVSLSGTGTAGVSAAPTSLSFGSQTVGTTSASKLVQLTNNQSSEITISSVATTSGFARSMDCGSTLAAGASCNINVTFTPSTATAYSGSLSVQHSGVGSPTAVALTGTGVAATSVQDQLRSKIKHIVWIAQENRSFDSYFGRLGAYRAARGLPEEIDGLPLNVTLYNSKNQPIKPFPLRTVCHDNMSAGWNPQHISYASGAMNGFIKQVFLGSTNDPNYTRPMGYYDERNLMYYYDLATKFATSDRFFGSLLGPTNPNRLYMFAATSFGHVTGSITVPEGGFTQPTIFDKLSQARVPWRYYYQDTDHRSLTNWSTWSRDSSKAFPIAQYYTDLQNGTLPSFVFIDRGGGTDEHPGADVDWGVRTMKKMIDALMASSAWSSSIFIITFDESGGAYDHVPPINVVAPDDIAPKLPSGYVAGTFTRSGFRIPMIVVSPWIKPGFVSHTPRDLTAVLKLIETRFGLAPLTRRDASMDDMTEFFNFASPAYATPPKMVTQRALDPCDRSLGKAPGQ